MDITYERLKELCQAKRRVEEGHEKPPTPPTIEEYSSLAHLWLTLRYDKDHEDWELGRFIGFPEENNGKPTWEYDDGPSDSSY